MAYNWSISTTLRNPDRMIDWLKVVNNYLIGETWNNENQIRFQILLIQHKLYKPTNITAIEKEKFEDFNSNFTYDESKIMFEEQNYQDPAMRGRTSLSPFKKMGLIKISNNTIYLTSMGEYLLSDNYDFGYFLFRIFLKWEYKNPSEKGTNSNFNINPFIATLHLINKVNEIAIERNEIVKGISKDEFTLFVQTLTDYNNIQVYANELYNYRTYIKELTANTEMSSQEKEEAKKNKKLIILQAITQETNQNKLERLLNNLKDYTDNTIRYFRATRYLYIRGGGYWIDLEPRRNIEIQALLSTYDGSSNLLENEDEYVEYLSNINLPILPWETQRELTNIIESLVSEVNELESQLDIEVKDYSLLIVEDIDTLKENVEELRAIRKDYLDTKKHKELQNIEEIEKCIHSLNNIRNLGDKPSIQLEKWSSLALHALNDAISINPNYPVGDDNEPLFTAPAGKADIECYYNDFNSICEVTMLTGRNQWYNEGQPVMRHLRDFENINNEKEAYCLFLAPKMHQDTTNTFWIANKYEYEGSNQRIIPLTINQLIELLELLIVTKREGIALCHQNMKVLLDNIVNIKNRVNSSSDWLREIPIEINSWKNSILSN